jgi:hypothetical protein
MTYHEFLAYLFDRESTRELAIVIAEVVRRETDTAASAPTA